MNHLDITSRDALVQAINEFVGAVVIVSHDPHLIALTAERFWLVSGGRVVPFDGDMADYRALTLEQADPQEGTVRPVSAVGRKVRARRRSGGCRQSGAAVPQL